MACVCAPFRNTYTSQTFYYPICFKPLCVVKDIDRKGKREKEREWQSEREKVREREKDKEGERER